jgi:choline kinase
MRPSGRPSRAIILAAGRGQRLHPLTSATHKGLVEVGGATLLGRLVVDLAANGVDEITVVTGHCADAVEAYLLEMHPAIRFEFVHNPDFATSNNIVSLSLAITGARTGDVLLTECDLLLDDGLVERLAHGVGDVALVDRHVPGQRGSVVYLEDDGETIARFAPSASDSDAVAYKTVNLYRLSASFVAALAPRLAAAARARPDVFYETVFAEMIADRVPMRALVASPRRWIEIDTGDDLSLAERLFAPTSSAAPAPEPTE